MADVSSNENLNDLEDSEILADVSSNEDTFDQDLSESNSESEVVYFETLQSENIDSGTGDYTASLANIENLFKFQIAIIIGFLLVVCFIIGWKHD